MGWLRLHTGLIHLADAASKNPTSAMTRYSEALASYLDTYGSQSLQLPMLAQTLRTIMSPKDLQAVDEALTHRGPRHGLFQKGCGPQGCESSEAAFEVDPESNQVTVAIRRGSRIDVFSLAGESQALPSGIHGWLEERTSSVHQIVYKP